MPNADTAKFTDVMTIDRFSIRSVFHLFSVAAAQWVNFPNQLFQDESK